MVPELPPINTKSSRRIQRQHSNQIETHNELTDVTPEYTAQNIKCGHPLGKRSATKTIYDMLKIMGGRTARRYKWPWQVAILNRHKVSFQFWHSAVALGLLRMIHVFFPFISLENPRRHSVAAP